MKTTFDDDTDPALAAQMHTLERLYTQAELPARMTWADLQARLAQAQPGSRPFRLLFWRGRPAKSAAQPALADSGRRPHALPGATRRETGRIPRTLSGLAPFAVVLAIIIAAVALFTTLQTTSGVAIVPNSNGAPIDGIQCDTLEQTIVHYHAHLAIFINGQEITIPSDVGRQSSTGCFYWLHTHAAAGDEGVIHVESPDERIYQLYQFFDIWGQPLSQTKLLGHRVDADHPLTVYVYNPSPDQMNQWNPDQPFTVVPPSNLTTYTGDPRHIVLKPHELIVLDYGQPHIPPQAFTFPAGE